MTFLAKGGWNLPACQIPVTFPYKSTKNVDTTRARMAFIDSPPIPLSLSPQNDRKSPPLPVASYFLLPTPGRVLAEPLAIGSRPVISPSKTLKMTTCPGRGCRKTIHRFAPVTFARKSHFFVTRKGRARKVCRTLSLFILGGTTIHTRHIYP